MTILKKLSLGLGAIVAASALSSSVCFAEEQNLKHIYCAGPQTSEAQKQSMQDIAASLEKAGYQTFLPQRDGIESTKITEYLINKGHKSERSKLMVSKAVFALDAYQVLSRCDGVVANLMGEIPDDSAISEAAMAWSHKKPVVLYKAEGKQMNSLVHGLSDFKVVHDVKDIPKQMFKATQYVSGKKSELELPLIIQKGGILWDSMQKIQAETEEERNQQIAELVVKIFGNS